MFKTAEDIRLLNERVVHAGSFIDKLREEVSHVIVGQTHMLDRLLIGLLSNGHVLLEGVPGLAKTLIIKSLSTAIHAQFSRIQFTPDLLPADVIGTLIYNQHRNEFVVRKGPIFANFILADEINRAPAKVQSALLEAMQERQITIGDTTYKLEKLKPLISYGASPRGSINLALASKAQAFLNKRGFVIPEDVRAICVDVLRHRIGLTYEAEAENINAVDVIEQIITAVNVP